MPRGTGPVVCASGRSLSSPRARQGSGSQESQGDDGDAVGAAVGEFAGVENHPVDQAVAELSVKPVQVLDVGGADGVGELDLVHGFEVGLVEEWPRSLPDYDHDLSLPHSSYSGGPTLGGPWSRLPQTRPHREHEPVWGCITLLPTPLGYGCGCSRRALISEGTPPLWTSAG